MEFVLYLFDQTEALTGLMQNAAGSALLSAVHDEEKQTLTVMAEGAAPSAASQGGYMGFYDLDGRFQLFEIKRMEEQHQEGGMLCELYGEHVLYELLANVVTDLSLSDTTAEKTAQAVLASTRWQCAGCDNLLVPSISFYYESALACLYRLRDQCGARLAFHLTLEGNSIGTRTVSVLTDTPRKTGKRFTWSRDLTQITREADTTNLVTALYGRGKAIGIKESPSQAARGARRTFADAVWTVPQNPVDKPAGQEWVGDPQALAQWGYGGAEKRHRFGVAVFSGIDDPAELLQETYNTLQSRCKPVMRYSMKAVDLEMLSGLPYEAVRLNDEVTVIDDGFSPPLEITARITGLKRDYLNPADTTLVIGEAAPALGSLLAKMEAEKDRLLEKEGVWDDTTQTAGPNSPVDTSRLEGAIDALQNKITASGAYDHATVTEGGGILLENNQADSPDYGALYLGPGILAIASQKNGIGWEWRTFGTGKGFTASELITGVLDAGLIKTGRLESVNGSSWIDMQSGAFSFDNGKLSLDGNGNLHVAGYLTAQSGNRRVSINDELIGYPMVAFSVEGNDAGYLYASEYDRLIMEANGCLQLSCLSLETPGGHTGYSGDIQVGGKTLRFDHGLLYEVTG